MKCKFENIECRFNSAKCQFTHYINCQQTEIAELKDKLANISSKNTVLQNTNTELLAKYTKAKDTISRRNVLITDLRGQIPSFTIAEGYQIKHENFRITHSQNPILYALEDRLYEAIDKILKHRESHYEEDYWKEALPATLFAILDHYDRNAVKVAVKEAIKMLSRITPNP